MLVQEMYEVSRGLADRSPVLLKYSLAKYVPLQSSFQISNLQLRHRLPRILTFIERKGDVKSLPAV
jgi:hypothetical protein